MAKSQKQAKKSPVVKGQARLFCQNGPRVPPQLSPAVMADPLRARAILASRSKWVNGTVLHYCFFTSGHFEVPRAHADAVRKAFAKWKAVGIGLEFQEVSQLAEAEVRIGYSVTDGSSASQVGRDVLQVSQTEPTTVYGWDLTSQYGSGTALHELGHVLGMEHEHQNPSPASSGMRRLFTSRWALRPTSGAARRRFTTFWRSSPRSRYRVQHGTRIPSWNTSLSRG